MTELNGERTPTTTRRPPLARLVGRRPNRGAAVAAKDVVADVQTLVKAEIALAKAEVLEGVKAKVMGAGFFIGVAVIGWLFIQAFLVFLGFVFGTFMPPWAAAGMVVLLLLIGMGILGFLGYRKLQTEISTEVGSDSREESQRVAKVAVERAQENTREGVEEAKHTVAETFADVKMRLQALRGKVTGSGAEHESPAPQLTASSPAVATSAVAAGAPPAPAIPEPSPAIPEPSPAAPEPAPATPEPAPDTPETAPATAPESVTLSKPDRGEDAGEADDPAAEATDALPEPPDRPGRRPPGSTWNPQPRPTQDDELG